MAGVARPGAPDQAVRQLQPEELVELLLGGGATPRPGTWLGVRPWCVRWDRVDARERGRLLAALPAMVGFRTSGQTGEPALWWRSRDQLLGEVDLLGEVCGLDRQDGVVAFAPPQHLYGFLLSFLHPAVRGLPAWFLAAGDLSWTACDASHPLVVAIPSALAVLGRNASELVRHRRLTVLHSSAALPPSARSLRRRLGDRLELIELFGSTETGAVAVRWPGSATAGRWRLMPDVEFAAPRSRGAETRLAVRGPRIATPAGGVQPREWRLDDSVRILGPRSFRFEGRRSRLVNINGRRVDLDAVERRLRRRIAGLDLACAAVHDPLRGESYELLVAAPDGVPPPSDGELRLRCRELLASGERPRRVRVVPRIERTALGKLRSPGFGA